MSEEQEAAEQKIAYVRDALEASKVLIATDDKLEDTNLIISIAPCLFARAEVMKTSHFHVALGCDISMETDSTHTKAYFEERLDWCDSVSQKIKDAIHETKS